MLRAVYCNWPSVMPERLLQSHQQHQELSRPIQTMRIRRCTQVCTDHSQYHLARTDFREYAYLVNATQPRGQTLEHDTYSHSFLKTLLESSKRGTPQWIGPHSWTSKIMSPWYVFYLLRTPGICKLNLRLSYVISRRRDSSCFRPCLR